MDRRKVERPWTYRSMVKTNDRGLRKFFKRDEKTRKETGRRKR